MKAFGELIYSPERASGEALSKVESHTPKITAPESVRAGEPFEVEIKVGPHPNTEQHSIRRIEVYFYEEGRPFNPILVTSVDLAPVYAEPVLKVTLKLSRSGTIYAVEYCNLHGLWEAGREVRVTA